jgi:hypothetical protein
MQLRSGGLAAPAARCLPLLPSGSGGVHRATMRETRSSTPHEPSGAQVIGGLIQPKLLVSPGGAHLAAAEAPARRPPTCSDLVPTYLVSWRPAPADTPRRGGGEAGIRTRGGVSPTHALQACSFNHSDTSPYACRRSLLHRTPRVRRDRPSPHWPMVWRRGWDSNPRGSCPPTRFRGGPVTTTSVPLQRHGHRDCQPAGIPSISVIRYLGCSNGCMSGNLLNSQP